MAVKRRVRSGLGWKAWVLSVAVGCGGSPSTEPVEEPVEEVRFLSPAGTEHLMVRVHTGPFEMGSEAGNEDEQPVHDVFLDTFFIDKYEVTNAQYLAFVEAGGRPQHLRDDRFNAPDQPAVGVVWAGAVAYCEWAGMRLPTEAEWEKAARGTDGRTYPWGNEKPDPTRLRFDSSVSSAPVGSFSNGVSPYGAHDMAGNVWEWTRDEYDSRYYARSPDRNPVNLFWAGRDVNADVDRTLRGGGWSSPTGEVRASVRRAIFMLEADGEIPDSKIGFRCARDVE